MSPAKKEKPKKTRSRVNYSSDIYTTLLGLTVLILAATTLLVCLRSHEMYGQIFKIIPQ